MKAEILEILTYIPYGRITSYGHVAEILDHKFHIKTSGWMVGKVLSGMTAEEQIRYPWRRVVNKDGYVSTVKLGERGLRQIVLLEKEKVVVLHEVADTSQYGWRSQE